MSSSPKALTCQSRSERPVRRQMLVWLSALFLALASSVAVAGDGREHAGPPPEMIRQLILWVGEHTEYDIEPTLADLPEVCFCETGEKIDYEGRRVLVEPGLRALYDADARRIYLVDGWSRNNQRHVSNLLHELIHDIQLSNRDWSCVGAPEWQAYKLQEAWLAERGIKSGFNWLHIFFKSRCPRDIHP